MKVAFASSPIVGMPVRMDPGKDIQYLSRHYADSVAASGGTPVLIPLLEDPAALQAIVRRPIDGILLTGSNADVEPSLYGEEREPACGPAQPLRNQTDFFLLEAAMAHRIPVLAICFGIQSLNVFMGGTLIQDIPTRLGLAVRHSEPRARFVHPVEFAPGSILSALAGSTGARVNSTRHQCIDRVGGGLQVIGAASDGVIEAVVGTAPEQWILGVQWHPEKSFGHDELSRRIFGTFIDHCRTRRAVDEGAHPEAARAGR